MHDVPLYENMVSRTGQEIRLKQYPKGMPTEDIFELAKVDVPEPKEGEFLCTQCMDVCRPVYAWTDEESSRN